MYQKCHSFYHRPKTGVSTFRFCEGRQKRGSFCVFVRSSINHDFRSNGNKAQNGIVTPRICPRKRLDLSHFSPSFCYWRSNAEKYFHSFGFYGSSSLKFNKAETRHNLQHNLAILSDLNSMELPINSLYKYSICFDICENKGFPSLAHLCLLLTFIKFLHDCVCIMYDKGFCAFAYIYLSIS